MKQILLFLFCAVCFVNVQAQKSKKLTAFAITPPQKGQSGWSEVRLVDIASGEEVKTIYQNGQEIEILNARTGKPIVKKDIANNNVSANKEVIANAQVKADGQNRFTYTPNAQTVEVRRKDANGNVVVMKRVVASPKVSYDKPFATNSAALAYDRKHERLYYTPMGIAELRYIDLKSKTPKVYYFQDETFGALKHRGDVAKQITRMVIASDGDGYALTNDANHLIKFTTERKPVITDLGALTDDPANGTNTVHSESNYGGDVIADTRKNLYLITANRKVYKINLDSKIATYKGNIQGLPRGYTTNGAMVEEGNTVIVNSSNSTQGYYKFDLHTLQAEKMSASSSVFNASDLANGVLASAKKEKKEEPAKLEEEAVVQTQKPAENNTTATQPQVQPENITRNAISVFPNPVRNGFFKLSFDNQPQGRYQVEVVDALGKLISQREINIQNRLQVEEFRLPSIAAGNYLVKATNKTSGLISTHQLVVQ